jgi:peptide/nickel transport system permease protein
MTIAAKPSNQILEPAARGQSQAQVVWAQFKKHQLAIFGALILGVLYLGAIFAPFIAPYGMAEYSTTDITKYHPPTTVYVRDPETGRLELPFVYASKRTINQETFQTTYLEDRSVKYPLRLFVRRPLEPYKFLGLIPSDLHLFGVDQPGKVFLLGTDGYGRDLFTRIWYGAQISLTIGIISTLVINVLGVVLGGIAGFYRGWLDNLIMRFTEILAAIPDIFLLIALTALLPQNLDPILVFYGIVVMLGFINWGALARVMRGQILAMRDADFVQAAIALGASEARVIGRHMLPNNASFLIVNASLAIPGFILAESGLSFIGRGIREPYSSWGLLLNDVTQGGFSSFTDRPWVLIPGFFIVLTILSWNFVGDGLRDALDPKKRR